jgi:hypothetical protein
MHLKIFVLEDDKFFSFGDDLVDIGGKVDVSNTKFLDVALGYLEAFGFGYGEVGFEDEQLEGTGHSHEAWGTAHYFVEVY